jgi:hypothetical protein
MCLSRRAWIGILSSPFLGVAGYFLTGSLSCLISGKELAQWKDLFQDDFALYLAAPAAPLLVAAHHLHLRLRKRGLSPFVGTLIYGVLGALSGSVFWYREGYFAAGLLDGALYGLVQHVAMLCALGIEKWRIAPVERGGS